MWLTLLVYSGVACLVGFVLFAIKFLERDEFPSDTFDHVFKALRFFPLQGTKLWGKANVLIFFMLWFYCFNLSFRGNALWTIVLRVLIGLLGVYINSSEYKEKMKYFFHIYILKQNTLHQPTGKLKFHSWSSCHCLASRSELSSHTVNVIFLLMPHPVP